MPLTGEYEPSKKKWVRDQVERYEATGGREANTLRDTGLPVAIFTSRGAKSRQAPQDPADAGRARRGVRDGRLPGRGPETPRLVPQRQGRPGSLMVQDGAEPFDATARELR